MFVRYSSKPQNQKLDGIAVSPKHTISIGRAIADEYSLRAGDKASLWYDSDRRSIGLQPHGELNVPGSHTLTMRGDVLIVTAIGFCKLFSPPTGKYNCEYSQESGMLVCSPVGI